MLTTRVPLTEAPTVQRFIVSHRPVRADGSLGMRTMVGTRQGRYTFATREDAAQALRNTLAANTPADFLRYGEDSATFRVDEIACHAGHFDPVSAWVEE